MKKQKSGSRAKSTPAPAAAADHATGKSYWLDKPGSVDLIVKAVYAVCALLVVADFFVHKHGPFAIEHLFGFYAWYGFIACVGLVLAAKMMRRALMRAEDYYDR